MFSLSSFKLLQAFQILVLRFLGAKSRLSDESLRASLAKNALRRLADFEPAKIALKYKELILS